MRFLGFWTVVAAMLAVLAEPVSALAHPVGNFSVNRYSRIEIAPNGISVHYVVDMAEIPTLAEQAKLDRNHDGAISEEERSNYLSRTAGQLARNLDLDLDGGRAPLTVESTGLEFLPGQAGLQTMRLTLVLSAVSSGSAGQAKVLVYRDDNFSAEIGWGEVVIRGEAGVAIIDSTAPSVDVTNELRSYPPNAADRPPDRRGASATFVPDASGTSQAATSSPAGVATGSVDPHSASLASRFASSEGIAGPIADAVRTFVSKAGVGHLDLLAVALALLLAALWGAAHAISPGHGKTVVGAYLVGSHGTPLHALYLGLTVTATHTLGVYLLGAVALLATQFLPPDALYRWLAVVSSLSVTALGGTLVVSRAGGIVGVSSHGRNHDHHGHPHGRSGIHGHNHHGDDRTHRHADPAIAIHSHGRGADHEHSHLPPGFEAPGVSWRSLLALGVAGGLLPCPSALVLFLGALALGQIGFGLILVAAFSTGLAVVLTGVGIAFVYARRIFSLSDRGQPARVGAILRLVPVASALFILTVGLAMTVEALGQAGLLRL